MDAATLWLRAGLATSSLPWAPWDRGPPALETAIHLNSADRETANSR